MLTPEKKDADDRLARAIDAVRNESMAEGPSAEAIEHTIELIGARQRDAKLTWTGSYVDFSRQRGLIAAGALAAALLLIVFVINNSRPTLALAQVIEKIRSSQSTSFRVEQYWGEPRRQTGSTLTRISRPDKSRTDWDTPQGKATSIINGSRMLMLNAARKTALVGEIPRGGIRSEASALDELKSLVERDARTLGEKDLDGVRAKGFEAIIKDRKFTLWANVKTGEPVRIECEPLKNSPAAILPMQVLSDFKFDEKFPEELFSLDIPADYYVTEQRHESVQPIEMVATYLKEYAARHAGQFPLELKPDTAALAAALGLPEDRRKFSEAERKLAAAVDSVAMVLKTAAAGRQYQYFPGGKLGQENRMVFWCVDPLITATVVPLVPSPQQVVQPPPRSEDLKGQILFGDLQIKKMSKDQLPPAPVQ